MKMAEVIIKKIPEIKRQNRQSLQAYEGISQGSEALICNVWATIY